MSKRVRYFEETTGVFKSTRTITTNHGPVLIRYVGENFLVTIIKADEPNVVLDSFTAPTAHTMKKMIKTKLVSMGATFNAETRVRGTAV